MTTPQLTGPWRTATLKIGQDTLILERCITGRLRDAYPAGEHDVEVQLPGTVTRDLLRRAVAAVESTDPRCRRVVFAAGAGDLTRIAAAEAAGFRYVVDVDLPPSVPPQATGDVVSLSLLVAEPGWVTRIDGDTDAVTATPANRRS